LPSGTLVQTTAQSWLIFQLTNPPFSLGLEWLCLSLPWVIVSSLGGAILDRVDRKILFVATQTAFLLMALFLGVMDYIGTIRVWHVLTISGLTGFFVATIGNLIVLHTDDSHRRKSTTDEPNHRVA
jgi:Transmembrane secretion effector